MFKRILLTIVFVLVSHSLFAGTITRGKIGKEDVQLYDGLTDTFTRPSSTGGTSTLHNFDYGGVDVLQVYGDGSTCDDATIRNAVNQVGSSEVMLNMGTCTWTLTSSLTTNANTTLYFPIGGQIQGTAGGATETLTINGDLIASPAQQIFGSDLTVDLAKKNLVTGLGSEVQKPGENESVLRKELKKVFSSKG